MRALQFPRAGHFDHEYLAGGNLDWFPAWQGDRPAARRL